MLLTRRDQKGSMESEEMTVILDDGGGEVLVISTRPLAVFWVTSLVQNYLEWSLSGGVISW